MSEFWWLVLGYVMAIALASYVLLLIYRTTSFFVRHTHEFGHCGYSGCQADLRRVR